MHDEYNVAAPRRSTLASGHSLGVTVVQSLTSSLQALWLVRAGIGLLLAASLLGLAIPQFAVPRLALSGHLIALLQGIAAPLSNVLGAVLGAGNSILPIAAGSAHGGTAQELVINIGLRSAGAAVVVGLTLMLWGLRRAPAA